MFQGGWGWLVVGAAFLVQVLTTGLQLAFGVMAAQIARHFARQENSAASLHMDAGQFAFQFAYLQVNSNNVGIAFGGQFKITPL